MLVLPRLFQWFAVLGLGLLSCAPALASGGADCHGHGAKSPPLHVSAYPSPANLAQLYSVSLVNSLQPQEGLVPTSGSAELPAAIDAEQVCGSCANCAACCLSVAPPLSLRLPEAFVAQGRVSLIFEPHLPAPDLAALERPPQPAPAQTA